MIGDNSAATTTDNITKVTTVTTPGVPVNVAFVLDGRFLRAFNGPGMGAFAVSSNFAITGFYCPVPPVLRPRHCLPSHRAIPTSSAWTRTTTPATWRTGSWRSRAPTAR